VSEPASYTWPLHESFLNRNAELERLEDWWQSRERMPLNLYGRRRVGKSWLFRRFAHGKPAVLLVAHRVSAGAQLTTFAERLEPLLGFRPDLPDVPALFRVLFRASRQHKILAVIDEFPWLLPGTESGTEALLSAIQAVLEEERDTSRLKLILCGSQVGQMESLMSERNPLHGRLVPVQVRPLPYPQARPFLTTLSPLEAFERYAITGGMPRYLAELGSGTTRSIVSRRVLDRDGPLWDEARTVLDQELRESRVYFAIAQQLAGGDKELNAITQATRLSGPVASKYLHTLEQLKIVRRRAPVGASADSRSGRWRLEDPFFRFWFRFVFPYQDELESGLRPLDLFDGAVAPALPDHVAPVFESWCRDWTRSQHGRVAHRVGAWWGPALHGLRKAGERFTEEIDIVGLGPGREHVTVAGEAKWTTKQMGLDVLHDLQQYKLPALRQSGMRISPDIKIVLFSKSGYSRSLRAAADADPAVTLLDIADLLNIDAV